MFILRAIILVLALFMGVFFTIFVLTAIEAKSPKFEDSSRRIHKALPEKLWLALFIGSLVIFLFVFYKFTGLEYVRIGIFTGLISGLFLYFRAGPNINREEMERDAQRKGANPTGFLNFFQGPDKSSYQNKKPAKNNPYKSKKNKKRK